VVEREIEKRRAKVGSQGGPQRLINESWNFSGALGRGGQLDQRADERDMVDLLQRTLTPAQLRCASTEDEHRRVVLAGGRNRAHAVGDPRSGGERTYARRAGDFGPGFRGERGCLFVADIEDVDTLRA